jgi:hypothetical protein
MKHVRNGLRGFSNICTCISLRHHPPSFVSDSIDFQWLRNPFIHFARERVINKTKVMKWHLNIQYTTLKERYLPPIYISLNLKEEFPQRAK